MAISVVLSVVSVRVTPRVAKKGGMLFVVIDCLLFVVVVVLLFTSLSRTDTRLKHLFFILVVQISNILHLFRNCCKLFTLEAAIKISAPRA